MGLDAAAVRVGVGRDDSACCISGGEVIDASNRGRLHVDAALGGLELCARARLRGCFISCDGSTSWRMKKEKSHGMQVAVM